MLLKTPIELSGGSRSGFRPVYQRQSPGFTIIELVIVVVIIAIGVALAVPSFRSIIEKRQLTSATEEIAGFMRFAKSEAIKRNDEVIVNMRHSDNKTWCIGATLGMTACDCRPPDDGGPNLGDADFCDIEDVAYQMDQADVVSNPDYELMQGMEINDLETPNGSFSFDPVRGTLSALQPINFQLHTSTETDGTREYQLEVNVLATGRVQICTDTSGAILLKQYPTCP
jgi:type IV fimbrial biogenesis protein FimT